MHITGMRSGTAEQLGCARETAKEGKWAQFAIDSPFDNPPIETSCAHRTVSLSNSTARQLWALPALQTL